MPAYITPSDYIQGPRGHKFKAKLKSKFYTLLWDQDNDSLFVPIKAVKNPYFDPNKPWSNPNAFAGGHPAFFGGTYDPEKHGDEVTTGNLNCLIQELKEESRQFFSLKNTSREKIIKITAEDGKKTKRKIERHFFYYATKWECPGGNNLNDFESLPIEGNEQREMKKIVELDLKSFKDCLGATDVDNAIIDKLLAKSGCPLTESTEEQEKDFKNSNTRTAFIQLFKRALSKYS